MQAVLNTVNPIQTAIRSIFVLLDIGVYDLLRFVYELFFNIASMSGDFLDREMIYNVFSRVQLVIGIFMLFQLVMIVIKGIVNPDMVSDSKSGGAGSMVMRIIVALALLAVIVPINIPSPKNEYEKQINNNGLLFGTLYSLQYRILSNNTMGRLILGDDDDSYVDGGVGIQDLDTFAKRFTSTIVKTFYTLNIDEDTGKYVCNDGFDKTYEEELVEPNVIILNGTQACGSGNFILDTAYSLIDPAQVLKQGQQYRVTMNWLSTIIGIILAVLFFMMTFNVAKRVFKLAALQLIAPIPIISYMDPKGSKDGAFNSWVKLLTSTYLELFIQLAVIYFSFSIINSFITKFFSAGTVVSSVTSAYGGDVMHASALIRWTFIVMTIALFIFAKDAPKFLKQAVGIKTDTKFFESFGQALGVGAVAAGAVSSGVAGATSSYQKNAGKNKGKQIGAGILGGLAGAASRTVSGGKEFFQSKDGNFRGIMEGNRKHAAQLYSNAADESTPRGRFMAGLQSNLGLKNDLQAMDDKMKYYNAADSALGRINKAFDSNGDYKVKFNKDFVDKLKKTGTGKGFNYSFNANNDLTDRDGNVIFTHDHSYSLKELNDMISRVSSSGDATMKDAVDEAKKQAQGMRFLEIRALGDDPGTREKLVQWVNDPSNKDWNDNDLVTYDALHTIYEVSKKYANEDKSIFEKLNGKSFGDQTISWGQYKGAASGAGRKADQIKNSNEYAQAAANARRAQEANKKK